MCPMNFSSTSVASDFSGDGTVNAAGSPPAAVPWPARSEEVAGQIERAYPGYHVWTSDAGWWYATRMHPQAPGQAETMYGHGPGELTVALAAEEAAEGLSVIVREGLRGHLTPGATPLLAAALTEPTATESPTGSPGAGHGEVTGDLLAGRDPEWLLTWWQAYVRAVAPPALHALFGHGVVLEPHLQNVLVGVDGDGLPVQAIFRDLEGAKLVTPRHDETLAALKPEVAQALGYDTERAWHRVAYCLFVNHLAEIAATIADRHPGAAGESAAAGFEAALWDRAREVLTGFAGDHGWPPQLLALLAGVPLPAKANLRLRWARGADREAAYVSVPNPLGGQLTGRRPTW